MLQNIADALKVKPYQLFMEPQLNQNNIEYTINSGKFITFKYNGFTFKVEVVKKAAMPA